MRSNEFIICYNCLHVLQKKQAAEKYNRKLKAYQKCCPKCECTVFMTTKDNK